MLTENEIPLYAIFMEYGVQNFEKNTELVINVNILKKALKSLTNAEVDEKEQVLKLKFSITFYQDNYFDDLNMKI